MLAATGACAQAYLVSQGVSLSHEEVELSSYDDATGLLLALKGGHIFAYDASAGGPHNLRWMYPLQVTRMGEESRDAHSMSLPVVIATLLPGVIATLSHTCPCLQSFSPL